MKPDDDSTAEVFLLIVVASLWVVSLFLLAHYLLSRTP